MALIKPFITSFVKSNAKSWSAFPDRQSGTDYFKKTINKAMNCHRPTP